MKEQSVSASVQKFCSTLAEKQLAFEKIQLGKLDQLTLDIKFAENFLSSAKVHSFSYTWDNRDEWDGDVPFELSSSIIWNKDTGYIEYFFSENDEAEVLRGCTVNCRLRALEHFDKFFEAGIAKYKRLMV